MDLKRAMAINVRRERHSRNLSQEELADRAGLSARYLGSIERARVSASVTVLGRLAEAFRIDPGDPHGGVGSRPARRRMGSFAGG